ncbi:MAG: serine/threonine-protein kinase [Candidatus Woesebacteria bacterium]|jgi:serine/threonine protein kinase
MEPLRPDDPKQIGHFATVRVLGQGGMGRVYLGIYSEGNGQHYAAVKVMSSKYTSDLSFVKRFQREIRAAQKVQGYFTANVLCSGVDGKTMWFASEYIPGKTLAEAICQSNFDNDSLIKLAWSLYYAIVAIHNQGIVHRDLKPQNIILSKHGLRVIDFGVAYISDESTITATGLLLGTPHYMAPEQIAGEKPAAPWDIFAFGCILTYAATGHHAFGDNVSSAFTVCNAVTNLEPNLDNVPDSVRTLVEKCLNKDPSKRATLEDIRRMLPDVPHSAITGSDWLPQTIGEGVAEVTRVMPAARDIKRVILAQPKSQPQPEQPKVDRASQPSQKRSRSFSDVLQIILIITVIVLVLMLANQYGLLDRKANNDPQPSPSTTSQSFAPHTKGDEHHATVHTVV